jgi:hypothetical protein
MMKVLTMRATILSLLMLLVATPLSAKEKGEIEVGKPERIEVFPTEFALTGVRQKIQLVVTAYYKNGISQDVTSVAKYIAASPEIAETVGSVVYPRGDGEATIKVAVGGKKVESIITVSGQGQPEPVSFQYETLVALSKQGCNAGACHGSPSGKGGFRLSLRAFDPPLDQLTLIREDYGRRANVLEPENSLLLLKPTMKSPHGGGRQLKTSDPAYDILSRWIGEGCKLDDPERSRCLKIEIYPPAGRVLEQPAHFQQLCVLAHFDDGAIRDITELAVYSSSNEEVASANVNGRVEGYDRGEVAIVVRYLEFIESTFITFVTDVEGYAWQQIPQNNYVDELVDEKLQQLKYLPSEACSDDEFIRRVYLDVIGILPTVDEVSQFAANTAGDKRALLINQLLDRPEYAKFWALKWGDLLRLTSSQVGGDGVYKYYRWLETSFRDNMPYDEFARELLASTGSTMNNPAANFYRTAGDMNDCVETVSQVFLGARLQCAKCHNHPFERWTQDNYYGMAAFFNRIQRKKTRRADELFIWVASSGEVTQPRTGLEMKPWLPEQGDVEQPDEFDRRVTFVDWLTRKDNRYFGTIEVNRMWSQLFGQGIVDPSDDFRDTNPPSNAALLTALASDFSESGFDRKHILRTMLNSRTYQASFRPNDFNETDSRCFSHFQPRMLSAEQLLDAICHVTGLPETFGPLPAGTRATQLPAPDLVKNDFLKIFGQPERQTVCACERTSESNLGMAIQFFNGPLVYNKLRDENNRFRRMLKEEKSDEEIIRELYLAAVCRHPTDKEMEASMNHIKSKEDRIMAFEDICWAIINTNEFLFQH